LAGTAGAAARREWFLRDPARQPERPGGFCGEADRVVAVRLAFPVSGPPEGRRCPAGAGSAGAGGSVPVRAAVAGTGRPTLVRWRWTVTAAFGLGGIAVSAWGPRLPAIKAALGTGTATIGLLLAGVTVGAMLGLLASTPVLHWLGSRRSLAGALLLIAAAMTALGLALMLGSVPLVAAVFVIIGLGIGILDVLINVEGSAVEQATGRTLMPMMHAAWSTGVAAGAGIGAACAALGVSPAAQFIAEALVIAATALGTAAGIPGGRRAPPQEPHQDRGAKLRQWLRGWLDWRLLLIGVVMLGVELGEGSAANWLTLAAHNGHGQTATVAALFVTAFAAAGSLRPRPDAAELAGAPRPGTGHPTDS